MVVAKMYNVQWPHSTMGVISTKVVAKTVQKVQLAKTSNSYMEDCE